MAKKRKPTHPGEILDELYIKPLKMIKAELHQRRERAEAQRALSILSAFYGNAVAKRMERGFGIHDSKSPFHSFC